MVLLAIHSLSRFCFDVAVLGKTHRQPSLVPNMSQITVSCFFFSFCSKETRNYSNTETVPQFDALLFVGKGLLEYELP
jgi:hypothetical protein